MRVRSAAMRPLQHVHGTRRDQPREVLGRRPAERPRPDVGIAEREHGHAAGPQRLDELDAAEGEFLSVVDEDGAQRRDRAQGGGFRRKRPQELDRFADEAGRVAVRAPHARAHVAVLAGERGHRRPDLDAVRLRAGGELGLGDPERRQLGEERAHLGAEAAGRAHLGRDPRRPARAPRPLVLRVARQEVLHDAVLVWPCQQLRGVGVDVDRRRPHDLVGERRDGLRERPGRRDLDGERQLVAQRGRRRARRRQHEHLLDRQPRRHERRGPGDDDGRLARAGCPDDGARGVRRKGDDAALGFVRNEDRRLLHVHNASRRARHPRVT
jgi:hypothetical protein